MVVVDICEKSWKGVSTKGGRRGGGGREREKQITTMRKRRGKWTEGDQDLAERELAVVIVERQQVGLTMMQAFLAVCVYRC